MSRTDNLRAAKSAKNDEFYTLLPDIERELARYRRHFVGKIVYCNCDDPAMSQFWAYFHLNFEMLGLKRLVSTYHVPGGLTYKLEYWGGHDADLMSGARHGLYQDGDFRSFECVELLKEADLIVTNPPFSLFREYIGLLMKYRKKFLIIGSMNAITYRDVFRLIQSDEVWLGYHSPRYFRTPDGGLKAFGNVLWYTNLDIEKRHEPLVLYAGYNSDTYPGYANYKAIEVGRTQDIPFDYAGEMGVPISFLTKYCPEQFEIIGHSRELALAMSDIAPKGSYVQGGPRFYIRDGDNYRRMYDRIVIRRR